ncbi:MAG TPA: HesA/MoeB/ThiF family protein [Candidatus Thermoplasmatota archaeon]|nr:HesA/MoeB/ThiF family protein [Candidatus Thermoplasmatota archaeon]
MPDDRHARQVRLPEVGEAGQARLRKAKVLVVGLGGLGCPAAQALVGAGVGTVGLCDFDRVDATNLHRQPLYAAADVGRPKVDAARARLAAVDAAVHLALHPVLVDGSNALGLVHGYDLVVDGLDDLAARYALGDACRTAGIPIVHGAVSQWEGQVAVFLPQGPCYRCLHPVPPAQAGPTCAEAGVLGPLPGLVGMLQANEALKVLLELPTLAGRLWLHDGKDGTSRTITLKRRPGCACTMTAPGTPAPHKDAFGELPAEGAPVACPLPWAAPDVPVILAETLVGRESEVFLLDVREPDEHEEANIPGSALIPLGSLQRRLSEVPKDRQVVVYCAVGGRSARATHFLRQNGVEAANLHGGIRAWLQLQP